MNQEARFVIEIVELDNDNVVQLIPCRTMNQRNAEQTMFGVSRNLNHDKYYTRLVDMEED